MISYIMEIHLPFLKKTFHLSYKVTERSFSPIG